MSFRQREKLQPAFLLASLPAFLPASQGSLFASSSPASKEGERKREDGNFTSCWDSLSSVALYVCVEASGAESALVEKKRPLPLPGRHWRWHDDGLVYAHDRKIIINIEQKGGGRPKASVVMQRLSYSTDTVLSNNITRDRIVKTVLENHYDGDVYRGQVTAGPSASLDSLRAFVA